MRSKTIDELILQLQSIKQIQGGETVVKVWSDIEKKDLDIDVIGFAKDDEIVRILTEEY